MRHTIVLLSCWGANLVSAYTNESPFGSLDSIASLQVRNLNNNGQLLRRADRPPRGRPSPQRGQRGNPSSSGGPRGNSPGRGATSAGGSHGASTSNPARSSGLVRPIVKASATMEGPATYFKGEQASVDPSSERPIPAGQTQRVAIQSSKYAHMHLTHQGSPATAGQRWPIKAKASGNTAMAIVRAPPGGSGHMLMTSPDMASKQIHVPGGATRLGWIDSQKPGAARVRAAVSKGGLVDITAGDTHHDRDRMNAGAAAMERDYTPPTHSDTIHLGQ